jgi:hypothetical protein
MFDEMLHVRFDAEEVHICNNYHKIRSL